MNRLLLFCICAISVSGAFGFLFGGDNEICCPEEGIGCFKKEGVFDHLPLPECPSEMDLMIGMFTRDNKYAPYYLSHDGVPSSFNGKRRTVFVAHGYQSDFYTEWLHEVKDLILEQEDANVVIVGWGKGAQKINYPLAASNTRVVGAAIAVHALKMREMEEQANIWCVGFSLGSHLCGHMGARVHLQRITGLDPAGPSFDSYDLEAGLNPNRADLVDVIHTDGWGVIAHYGTLRPLGDIDYYPNGGYYQPGCWTRSGSIKRKEEVDTTKTIDDATRVLQMIEYGQAVRDGIAPRGEGLSCSHSRAPKYFVESIQSQCMSSDLTCTDFNSLPGSCSKCTSSSGICGVMGYFADKFQPKGLFYTETNSRVPFCVNAKK